METIHAEAVCGRCVLLDEKHFPETSNQGGWCFLVLSDGFSGVGLAPSVANEQAVLLAFVHGARLKVELDNAVRLGEIIGKEGGTETEVRDFLRPGTFGLTMMAWEAHFGKRPDMKRLEDAYRHSGAWDARNEHCDAKLLSRDGSSWPYHRFLHDYQKKHPNLRKDLLFHRALYQRECRRAAPSMFPDHSPFPNRVRLPNPVPDRTSRVMDRTTLSALFLGRLQDTGPQLEGSTTFVDAYSRFTTPHRIRDLAWHAATGHWLSVERERARHPAKKEGGLQFQVTPEELAEAEGQAIPKLGELELHGLDAECLLSSNHPGIQVLVDLDFHQLPPSEVADKNGVPQSSLQRIRKGAIAFVKLVLDPGLMDLLPSGRSAKQRQVLSLLAEGRGMEEIAMVLGIELSAARKLALSASSRLNNLIEDSRQGK